MCNRLTEQQIFENIYELANILREDSSKSFAEYTKKVMDILEKPEDYCAAVMARAFEMAADNTISETSWKDFKKTLVSKGINDINLLAMGELYFYVIKYKKNFVRTIYKPGKILSIKASQMYENYSKLPLFKRTELKEKVKRQWSKMTFNRFTHNFNNEDKQNAFTRALAYL